MIRNAMRGIAGVGLALALCAGPLAAVADEEGGLSRAELTTLTQIFGHAPTAAEQEDYLAEYGSVPSQGEVDAYLAASFEEAAAPSTVRLLSDQSLADVSPNGGWQTPGPWFQSTGWILRNKVWSLSLMPRAGGIGSEGEARTWKPVYDRHNNDYNWKRYKAQGADASMYKQYTCHFRFGMLKTPWNLEPHKKAADIGLTCN